MWEGGGVAEKTYLAFERGERFREDIDKGDKVDMLERKEGAEMGHLGRREDKGYEGIRK